MPCWEVNFIVNGKALFLDRDALIETLKEMGFTVEGNKVFHKGEWCGNVKPKGDKYELFMEETAGGLAKCGGRNLGLVKQNYGIKQAVKTAREQGDDIMEIEELPDGAKQVVINSVRG